MCFIMKLEFDNKWFQYKNVVIFIPQQPEMCLTYVEASVKPVINLGFYGVDK